MNQTKYNGFGRLIQTFKDHSVIIFGHWENGNIKVGELITLPEWNYYFGPLV